MTLDDLKPGLRYSETLTVGEALTVPAQAKPFDSATDMPPVLATAQMIAFVEWTCVHALAPYLDADQRTVGTQRSRMTHTAAATPVGMKVTAEVELRFVRRPSSCGSRSPAATRRSRSATVSTERTVVDNDRFMARLAPKSQWLIERFAGCLCLSVSCASGYWEWGVAAR